MKKGSKILNVDPLPPAPPRHCQPARVGDWIQTFTGRQFWPLDPRSEEVCIEDIAHGLSLICRFGGQCREFYSVAEHSCHAAARAPRGLSFAALMHDASEAYIADVCRPLKRCLHGYKEAETRILDVIGEKYGIKPDEFAAVKETDNRMLATEALALLPGGPQNWSYDPAPIAYRHFTFDLLQPAEAERWFLNLFDGLKP